MIWDHLIFESCFGVLNASLSRKLKTIMKIKWDLLLKKSLNSQHNLSILARIVCVLVDPPYFDSSEKILLLSLVGSKYARSTYRGCQITSPPPPVSTKFSTNREVSERFVGQVPSVRNSLSRNFLLDRSTRCFSSATAKGGYFTPTVSREPL